MIRARAGRIAAIIRKDSRSFSRDRFLLLISLLALGVYIGAFYLLPTEIDETVRLGFHAPPEIAAKKMWVAGVEGLELVEFESSKALEAAIEEGDGDLTAGIDIPDLSTVRTAGQSAEAKVYVDARTPPEMRGLIAAMVRELVLYLGGEPLPITLPNPAALIVGVDRAGHQPGPRDQFRSFLALVILGMEMIALGSLVSKEVQAKTVSAVLATPVTVFDFLAAKAIFGTGLAMGQALIVLIAIGTLFIAPVSITLLLLLGTLMFTGFGMLAGARGRDFIEVMFWVMAVFIPSMVPAIAALFPGTTSTWVKLFPTYPLAAALDAVTSHGASLLDIGPWLAALAAWDVAIFGLGWMVLKRKVVAL